MDKFVAKFSGLTERTQRRVTWRKISALILLGTLSYFDLASTVLVVVLCVAIAWSVNALREEGTATLQFWTIGFVFRLGIAIAQTGNQLILVSNDANLYEANGRLLTNLPAEAWIGYLSSYTSSVRGIIILHGLAGKLDPVFRPGVYVALLSVACGSVAVALTLRIILPHISRRFRTPITAFLTLSPAFVFWGSQNTKEGFVCLGLTVFASGTLYSKSKLQIIGGVLLCWAFRPYIAAIVLAGALSAFGYSRFLARREQSRPVLLASCFAVLLGLGILNGSAIAGRDITTYSGGVINTGGGSLDPGVLGLAPSSPIVQGVRTFFTPPPWFIPKTPFELLSVIEGFVVAVALIVTLRRVFGPRGSRDFATLASFLTTFLVCAVYGIGSNIGTNVRIRTTVYPLVFALLVRSQKPVSQDDPSEGAELNLKSFNGRLTEATISNGSSTSQPAAGRKRDKPTNDEWPGFGSATTSI